MLAAGLALAACGAPPGGDDDLASDSAPITTSVPYGQVATAAGRIWAWTNGQLRPGFPADLTALKRYASNLGPCLGRAAGTCAFEAVASGDGIEEVITAYGQRWKYTEGVLQAGFPKDLTTIARYAARGGPCYGKAAGTCHLEAHALRASDGLEVVIADGKRWNYVNAVLSAGFPKDLTTIARYAAANGPCFGRLAGSCHFDSLYVTTDGHEVLTANGRLWSFLNGALEAGYPKDLTAIAKFAAGPCAGLGGGQCRLDSHAVYLPPNPNLQYFGYYSTYGYAGELTGHVNLLQLSANQAHLIPALQAARAQGFSTLVDYTGAFWEPAGYTCRATNRPAVRLKSSFAAWSSLVQAINAAGVADAITAFYNYDEPNLFCITRADLETVAATIKRDFPNAKMMVTYSYLGLANVDLPRNHDWIAFDEYETFDGIETLFYTLKGKLTGGQKIMLIGEGLYQHATSAPGAGAQQAIADRALQYFVLAQDPAAIGILTFLYPTWPTQRIVGVRDMPIVLSTYRQIGKAISGR